MKTKILCIICPIGCPMTVDYNQKSIKTIEGNRCKKGLEYAKKEIINPERTLTTTVKVKNGHLPLVSVKTNKAIPKQKIFDTMNLLANLEIEAPIKIGDIIMEDPFNTNTNIVATKNINKKTDPNQQ